MRRLLLAAAAVLALAAPGAAQAANVSVSSGVLTYTGDGTADTVTINWQLVIGFPMPGPHDGAWYVVASPGQFVPTDAGAGCTYVTSSRIDCEFATVTAMAIDGGAGDDNITIGSPPPAPTYSPVPATMYGSIGSDTLVGGDGNDTIRDELPTLCGQGVDLLSGGEGNDTLTGCLGSDTLLGGPGDDTLSDTSGGTETFDGGAGNDTMDSRDNVGEAPVCGPGTDILRRDALDTVGSDCELFVPRPVMSPTIAGELVEGRTITTSTGVWADDPTSFAYEWRRCDVNFVGDTVCTPLAGETAASYDLVSADVDMFMRVIVTGTNAAGSDTMSASTFDVAADTVAPETTIVRKPRSKTKARKATFGFRSSEAQSTFQCRLDDGRWRACKPPRTYKKLKPGLHVFRVRATDPFGNADPSPAVRVWRVKRK
jgi:hypothetical protein